MNRTAQIDVEKLEEGKYEVVVDNFESASNHTVILKESTYERLGDGRSREDFIRVCFRFLLEREPKEKILKEFDVDVIGTYYKDFEKEIISI